MDVDSHLHNLSSAAEKTFENVSKPLEKFQDDPIRNTTQKTIRATNATKNVVANAFDPRTGPHSSKAQKIVLIKGFFDVFLSLSIIFFPSLLYDGPLLRGISHITGLSQTDRVLDSPSAFALSSLIMGCGFAAISAGESTSDDAYKVVAALNGVFAFMSLLGCLFHPYKYGSSFLFFAGVQDVFWFYAIVQAGGYEVLETVGLSWAKISKEADKLMGKAAERYAADGASGAVQGGIQGGIQGGQSEAQRILTNPNPFKSARANN